MLGFACGYEGELSVEDYKKMVKRKMNAMIIVFFVGIATIVATLLLRNFMLAKGNDYLAGLFSGAGTGMIGVSVILWIKNYRVYKDEEKLKKYRIIVSDERNLKISTESFRIATFILLVVMYITAFVMAVFSTMVAQTLMILICVFVLAYVVTYRFIEKKY